MGTRSLLACALVATTLALLAGCRAGRGTSGDGGASDMRDDVAGDRRLDGRIRIAAAERAADGSATYAIDNVSGDDLGDLSAWINFFYEPSAESAIQIAKDQQPSPAQDLFLTKGETGHVVAAANPRPGERVIATMIEVEEDLPLAVVTGTRFLNGELECVAISSADDLIGSSPSQWIEVQNVSGRNVPAFEAVAVFIDPGLDRPANVKATSPKVSAAAMAPGDRQRLAFDLAGLGRLSNYQFLVKIRRIRKF